MALHQYFSLPPLHFQNFRAKEADNESLSSPWVLATGPTDPSDESQQSLRGVLMGVSTSGVSKLPSESELPRGKNEGLPLSTVFPTALTIYQNGYEVRDFCLTTQPTGPRHRLATAPMLRIFVWHPVSLNSPPSFRAFQSSTMYVDVLLP